MFLKFILGLLPIIWLILALIVLKWPTWKAAVGSMVIAAIEAILIWKLPVMDTASAALEGWLNALWPIVIVIVAAVFTYNLTVKTGAMDIIKAMMTSITNDKRILVLLIAWCFGGFMEGMAGFGTAIAIPAGMLAGMGFNPLFSCMVCLIANGVPTPFGSIGIPTTTLAGLVNLTNTTLSFTECIQLAPFFIICPFLIVILAGGKGLKSLKGVVPITLASGIAFIVPMTIVSYFVGAELAAVIGSVCSLGVVALMASKLPANPEYEMQIEKKEALEVKKCLIALSPFICIFVLLLGTSKLVPPVNTFLAQFSSKVQVYTGENPGTLTFSWINTPGVWIFISAIIGAILQKCSFKDFKDVFVATLKQMTPTILTMLSVLACAKIMSYSGMISDIASFCIAVTGSFFTFFAPWLGCLGTFVTGSGTSSGLLFGGVQEAAAETLGMDPYWVVGLNMLGVASGKMLSPQSIAIALSAVNGNGEDSKLLSMILPYGLVFLAIMSVWGYVGGLFL
jgi:lactate permease